jgi:osmosensitive K+ channel His kinase sensor protein
MHYRVIMAAISAVGIQHLDSLSDVVEKITAVWPRQTVPDQVVRTAGEIELVDAVPEALRERMARGHIYPAELAAAALGGLLAVHATGPGGPTGVRRAALAAQRLLIESLGGGPADAPHKQEVRWQRAAGRLRWPPVCVPGTGR